MNKENRNDIYAEIQKSVKQKYNVDLSIQEINSVTQSQYKIMVYGITKGFATALPFIGTFVPVDFGHYVETLIEPNRELQKELINEGKEEEAIEVMAESIKNFKQLVKDKKQGVTSSDSVIHSPSIGDIPEIVDIYKTFR